LEELRAKSAKGKGRPKVKDRVRGRARAKESDRARDKVRVKAKVRARGKVKGKEKVRARVKEKAKAISPAMEAAGAASRPELQARFRCEANRLSSMSSSRKKRCP
jgi:hypothetical protein